MSSLVDFTWKVPEAGFEWRQTTTYAPDAGYIPGEKGTYLARGPVKRVIAGKERAQV